MGIEEQGWGSCTGVTRHQFKEISIHGPVYTGQVLRKNVAGTGADAAATMDFN